MFKKFTNKKHDKDNVISVCKGSHDDISYKHDVYKIIGTLRSLFYYVFIK